MKNDLLAFIKNSGLSENEKSFWTKRADIASDAEKEVYFLLFKKYPEDLLWVTEALMRFTEISNDNNKEEYLKLQKRVHKKLKEILDKS